LTNNIRDESQELIDGEKEDLLMPSGFDGSKVIEEDSFCSSLKDISRRAENDIANAKEGHICKNPAILEKQSLTSEIEFSNKYTSNEFSPIGRQKTMLGRRINSRPSHLSKQSTCQNANRKTIEGQTDVLRMQTLIKQN